MDKDHYPGVLITEIVRYAKLSAMDPDHLDEYGAAIFATWYTQNPLKCPDRDNINNFEEQQDFIVHDKKSAEELMKILTGDTKTSSKRSPKKHKGIRFTAHTHPDEPLIPSPDDLSVYNRFQNSLSRSGSDPSANNLIHFIIDGYICRKAVKPKK